MATECSGVRSGCGCERFARQKQVSSNSVLERFEARRSPQRRSPGIVRESASWESGNQNHPPARGRPGCPGFQLSVLRPGREPAGAEAGAGGNLATWKPGTPGSRRGAARAGRRGPAVPECAPGAHSGGRGMATPMARPAPSPRTRAADPRGVARRSRRGRTARGSGNLEIWNPGNLRGRGARQVFRFSGFQVFTCLDSLMPL